MNWPIWFRLMRLNSSWTTVQEDGRRLRWTRTHGRLRIEVLEDRTTPANLLGFHSVLGVAAPMPIATVGLLSPTTGDSGASAPSDQAPLVYDASTNPSVVNLTLRYNPADNQLELVDTDNPGTLLASSDLDATNGVTITGADRVNTTLTIDYDFGGVFYAGGDINFNGGNGSGNKLVVSGGQAWGIDNSVYGPDSGSVFISTLPDGSFGNGITINDSQVATVDLLTPANQVDLYLPDTATDTIVGDDASAANNVSVVTSASGAFQTTFLTSPSFELAIQGPPSSAITVNPVDSQFSGIIELTNGLEQFDNNANPITPVLAQPIDVPVTVEPIAFTEAGGAINASVAPSGGETPVVTEPIAVTGPAPTANVVALTPVKAPEVVPPVVPDAALVRAALVSAPVTVTIPTTTVTAASISPTTNGPVNSTLFSPQSPVHVSSSGGGVMQQNDADTVTESRTHTPSSTTDTQPETEAPPATDEGAVTLLPADANEINL